MQKQAQEEETDGIRRYARGDYTGSLRRFAEAQRLLQSMDNTAGVARNQLHQAHAELALRRPQDALARANAITDSSVQAEVLLLQAQASLEMDRTAQAKNYLTTLDHLCETTCVNMAGLRLLQARVALAEKSSAEALSRANQALQVLQGTQERREIANAWRILAMAHLATQEVTSALNAAESALAIDRQLGLPEKIARDWLLLGDIQRQANPMQAPQAYRRALAVAQAAHLNDLVQIATQALQEKAQ